MPKKRIDIVSNGTASQYDIIVEESTDEIGAFSPARSLQVNGSLVSESNKLPVGGEVNVTNLPTLEANRMPVVVHVSNSSYSNYATSTRAGTAVIKASPGRLTALDLYSIAPLGTDNLYLQFFDVVNIPAANTRCLRFFTIYPDNSLLVYGSSDLEISFSTGITACISTTPDTYTAAVQSDYNNVFFTVTYK